MNYQEFIERKALVIEPMGLNDVAEPNPVLFDFQRDIVRWALRRGRAAIFADCGMGKTFMQLEWAKQIPGRVLILAPLAVAKQTIREGEKLGINIEYCRTGESRARIVITNYEMMEKFSPIDFTGIVLDESSILKSFTGSTRNLVIDLFGKLPFRLCCTATPSPNDFMELGNHSEFLGIMSRSEMLSMFFVHDGGETQKWRLKGHAESEFWKWICGWAVMIRKPSDLGYDDGKFVLPACKIIPMVVDSQGAGDFLFPMEAQTLQERIRARSASVNNRVKAAAKLIDENPGTWLVWCNLNSEADSLYKIVPECVNVQGSDSIEDKEEGIFGFVGGKYPVLVTKPTICGFGINMQNCHRMIFLGLSDSYEQFYQAIRRCWRFGQTKPVSAYVITASCEGAVVANIKRKEADAERMANEMVKHMKDLNTQAVHGQSLRNVKYIPTEKLKLPSFL